MNTTDGSAENVDLAVDEEALERYYRQRIKEITRDERPVKGMFIPVEEVRRVVDTYERAKHP